MLSLEKLGMFTSIIILTELIVQVEGCLDSLNRDHVEKGNLIT